MMARHTATAAVIGRVELPEGVSGPVEVRRIEVQDDIHNKLAGARWCIPGVYTALYRNGRLWMSDTTAEQNDHSDGAREIRRRGGRVLIAGLGLGMIVRAALACDNVEHVDVVEIDPDVVALVGPAYTSERCTIHCADILTHRWPAGSHWSVAWFDIWPDLCEDNLTEMSRLARSYGRRVDWQGYWGKELLRYRQRRTAAQW